MAGKKASSHPFFLSCCSSSEGDTTARGKASKQASKRAASVGLVLTYAPQAGRPKGASRGRGEVCLFYHILITSSKSNDHFEPDP